MKIRAYTRCARLLAHNNHSADDLRQANRRGSRIRAEQRKSQTNSGLLVGDIEVEEACAYLFEHQIPAYPYTTEKPVAVLGAKYRWARNTGQLHS